MPTPQPTPKPQDQPQHQPLDNALVKTNSFEEGAITEVSAYSMSGDDVVWETPIEIEAIERLIPL
jgi:hypothetical protein